MAGTWLELDSPIVASRHRHALFEHAQISRHTVGNSYISSTGYADCYTPADPSAAGRFARRRQFPLFLDCLLWSLLGSSASLGHLPVQSLSM